MGDGKLRIFLSAVSSEFESARNALADTWQAHDVTVRVQRSFRHDRDADTLLHKLHNYISDCNAVVCLLGARSGTGFPTAAEAAPFAHMLPQGITQASYTQWEFFIARHYHRRCLIYIARDEFPVHRPDIPVGDRADLQAAFVSYVESIGVQRQSVGNSDEFRAEVLKDLWPGGQSSEPIVALPYPSLGRLFKGREAFLRRLRSILTRPTTAAENIVGCAVHGPSGVGKTRAAVEYAWTHRPEYSAMVQLDSSTQKTLEVGLAELTGPLSLKERGTRRRAAAALHWFRTHPRWLLILDNIDSHVALLAATWLMGRLLGGHVLLTGRFTHASVQMERVDLDELSLEDAISYLMDATNSCRRKTADDPKMAQQLADELHRWALLLSIAADKINWERWSFEQYLQYWRRTRSQVVTQLNPTFTDYHRTLAETWLTAWDQLNETERNLLALLACLGSAPEWLVAVEVPGSGGEGLANALDRLKQYSLVKWSDGTITVHPPIGGAVLEKLPREEIDKRQIEAKEWMDVASALGPPGGRSETLEGRSTGTVEASVDEEPLAASEPPDTVGDIPVKTSNALEYFLLNNRRPSAEGPWNERLLAAEPIVEEPMLGTLSWQEWLNPAATQFMQWMVKPDFQALSDIAISSRRDLLLLFSQENDTNLLVNANADVFNGIYNRSPWFDLSPTEPLVLERPVDDRSLQRGDAQLGIQYQLAVRDPNHLSGLLTSAKLFSEAEQLISHVRALREDPTANLATSSKSYLATLVELLDGSEPLKERRSRNALVSFLRRAQAVLLALLRITQMHILASMRRSRVMPACCRRWARTKLKELQRS